MQSAPFQTLETTDKRALCIIHTYYQTHTRKILIYVSCFHGKKGSVHCVQTSKGYPKRGGKFQDLRLNGTGGELPRLSNTQQLRHLWNLWRIKNGISIGFNVRFVDWSNHIPSMHPEKISRFKDWSLFLYRRRITHTYVPLLDCCVTLYMIGTISKISNISVTCILEYSHLTPFGVCIPYQKLHTYVK